MYINEKKQKQPEREWNSCTIRKKKNARGVSEK